DAGERGAQAGVRMLGGHERTNYPFVMSVDDLGGGGFALTAQTDRSIDPQRVTGYLQEALSQLVRALEHAPEADVGELSILPAPERELLLEQFNATHAEHAREQCIHELFEARAQASPDAIAVAFSDRHLTYAELNRRANELAQVLRARGVGPD